MNVIARRLFLTAAILGSLLSTFAPPAVADAGDDQFTVAASHYRQHRWQLAAAEFQRMVADHPAHRRTADAVYFLGESLMQLGDYEQARIQFDRLLNDAPDHRFRKQAMFRRGEAAHFADADRLAREHLAQFVDQYGLDPLAAYAGPYLASRQWSAGEYRKALDTYDDSLRRFPAGPLATDAQFGRAQALQKLGRRAESVAAFQAIAAGEDHPFATQAQFQLGLMEYADGDFAAAERTLLAVEQALKQSDAADAALAEAVRYWLGLSLKGQEKWTTAAEALQAAAAQSSDEAKRLAAGYHAGDALFRAGLTDQAEAQFAAIADDADGVEWADDVALARLQLAIDRDDRAAVERFATMFEQKLAESPLQIDAMRRAGRYFLNRGEAEQAIKRLERIAGGSAQATAASQNMLRGKTAIEDTFTLAIALQRNGQWEEALRRFAEIADSDQPAMQCEALLAQATIRIEQDQHAEAVAPLERYLEVAPPDQLRNEAVEQLMICLAQSQQLDKARAHYKRLQEQGQGISPAVALSLAEAAMAAGDRGWAATLYQAIGSNGDAVEAEQSPDESVATPQIEEASSAVATERKLAPPTDEQQQKSLAGLAWSQYLDNAHEQSAATFEQLLKQYPDSPLAAEAAYTRGQALAKIGKLEPALEMYLLVVEQHHDSPQYESALLQAGSAYDALQHNEEALAVLDRLLSERPTSELVDDALYQSAWVARQLKRDDALARFARLHREHRDSKYWADATYRLAVDALSQEQHEQADRFSAELIDSRPPAEILEHTLYLRGQIAAAAGEWAAVEPPLSQLLEQFPDSRLRLASEYWLAESTYQQEKFEDAAARFDRLAGEIETVEGSWPAMVPLRRAQLRARNKDWAEAAQIAAQIPRLYPHFEQMYEVSYLLGRCRFAAAEFAEARVEFNEAIQRSAGRKLETAAMAQWMIGESYFHQKEYETAIREYFRVEALYDWPRWQAGALLQAGKCYEHLGEWTEAVALYDRIVDQYPDTMFTEEAARRRVVAHQRSATTRQ